MPTLLIASDQSGAGKTALCAGLAAELRAQWPLRVGAEAFRRREWAPSGRRRTGLGAAPRGADARRARASRPGRAPVRCAAGSSGGSRQVARRPRGRGRGGLLSALRGGDGSGGRRAGRLRRARDRKPPRCGRVHAGGVALGLGRPAPGRGRQRPHALSGARTLATGWSRRYARRASPRWASSRRPAACSP